jgi:hypothetical protein
MEDCVLFGNKSVDVRKIYEFGVKNGNRTEEARDALKLRLEDIKEVDERGQRDHLNLSSSSRFVIAKAVARTHNVQFVVLKLIAEKVKWVLGGLEK